MAPYNEEKTAFYTDHGTYCYTKIPFGLKNVGATYQRLVDTAFQSHIRRNLEAYVDDMVIKSNDEKVLIEDITKTFDNLRRIKMKLNLKKCSFGVKEGKFWVPPDSERDAEPEWKVGCIKKYGRGVLRDEKGHNGAATTNHPSKGGNDVRTRSSGNRVRKCRTISRKKREAIPIHYVSRTLNEAERNYAPLEKLALSLLHMSRRLQSTNNEAEYEALLIGRRMVRKDEGAKHRRKGRLEASSEPDQRKLPGK
uniref:Reverse transcriptase domain-containing protein n=1 Tax=Tanacetum cinerariifolium TaxID=118510 RepID=A0A6L2LIR3_TANCI|nr:reverse transcriptase domain-containing protein [Tanacetum cinerariifolium]